MSEKSPQIRTDEPLPELYLRRQSPEAHSAEDTRQPAPPPRDNLDAKLPACLNPRPLSKDDKIKEGPQLAPAVEDATTSEGTPTSEEVWDAIRGFTRKTDSPLSSIQDTTTHEDILMRTDHDTVSESAPQQVDEEMGVTAEVAATRRSSIIAVAQVVERGGAGPAGGDTRSRWWSDYRILLLLAVNVLLLIGLIVGLTVTTMTDSDGTEIVVSEGPEEGAPVLPGNWAQMGKNIAGESPLELYGGHVAISRDGLTVAGGANHYTGEFCNAGAARVHKFINGAWAKVGDTIQGQGKDDSFGISIALNGNGTIVAVGAYFHDPDTAIVACCNAGHVRVLGLEQDNWVQLGRNLTGEAKADRFGASVALSDDGFIVAVGARQSDRNGRDSGTATVYSFADGNWTQIGQNIDGEHDHDRFGDTVALSGDARILAVGSNGNSDNGEHSGHVRVYQLSASGMWEQLGQDIDGEAAGDRSSRSISLSRDGMILAVGANENDGVKGENSGHVRVFRFSESNGTWTQIGKDIDGEAAGDRSGRSIGLSNDGMTLVVGAPRNAESDVDAGHARIFKLREEQWIQVGHDIDGEKRDDECGGAVAISGDGSIVAIGAPRSNDGGSDSGHVRVFQLEL